MTYSFFCYGHPNLLAEHKNTIEFTKDEELTLNGDCIAGVSADFDLDKLKVLIANNHNLRLELKLGDDIFEINFEVNQGFNDDSEIVLRRSGFLSDRTLGIFSDKAAIDVPREMIQKMKDKSTKIEVIIYEEKDFEE